MTRILRGFGSLLLILALTTLCHAQSTLDFGSEDDYLISPPDGINEIANHAFTTIPAKKTFSDGVGLIITSEKNQGIRLLGPVMNVGEGKCLIEVSFQTSAPGAMLALGGLDSDDVPDYTTLNGSGAILMEFDSSNYQGDWHRVSILYDPPRNNIVPVVQVIGTGDTTTETYIDLLTITNLSSAFEQGQDINQILGLATPRPTPTPTPTPPPIGSPEAREALRVVNDIRLSVNLNPLAMHQALLDSAQAHADYMAQNNILEHTENITQPGFTGARAWDRATAAGYQNTNVWEVLGLTRVEDANPTDNVYLQMEGPFHRIPFLHSSLQHMGYGFTVQDEMEYHTFNLGSLTWDEIETIFYPFENQQDVPLSFGGYEFPDPFPNAFYPTGYPITIYVSQESDFEITSFSLKKSDGAELPVEVLLPGETRGSIDTDFLFAMAASSPLETNTTYEVTVDFVLNGESTSKTWNFTTTSVTETESENTTSSAKVAKRILHKAVPILDYPSSQQ